MISGFGERAGRPWPGISRRLTLLLALAAALGAMPADAMRVATNGILTVKMNDDTSPSGGAGLFTVETGASHPDPGKSVFYNSAANSIGTSYFTLVDEGAKVIWVNAEIVRAVGMTPAEAGYSLQCVIMSPLLIEDIGSPARGFRTTYTLPGFTVVQEVEIMGSVLLNTSVRQTVRVTNTYGAPASFRLRFLWDWMVAAVDASWFRLRDPDGAYSNLFQAINAPDFPRYEVANASAMPSFGIFGTCKGGSLLYSPTPPDELRYASWSDAFQHPWTFTVTGSAMDSAIVYYWGKTAPLAINDGETFEYTQYVTTQLDALRRAVPVLTQEVSNTGDACSGETLTYTVSFRNIGDATSYGLTIEDTLPVGTEYVPGSLAFWAQPDSLGLPVLDSYGFSGSYTGPWNAGEPPGVFGPPQYLQWVVDRLAPGASGYIRFDASVARALPPGMRLVSGSWATNLYDDTVFWSRSAVTQAAEPQFWKYAFPDLADTWEDVDYLLLLVSPCATTLYNISAFDSLPAGARFVLPLTGGGTLSGTTMVTWTVPALAPHASAYLTWKATMDGSQSLVGNWGEADYDAYRGPVLEPQPRLTTNIATVDVSMAQLYFRKVFMLPSVMDPAPRDGTVTFTIEVLNLSRATLYNVTVWDSLPSTMIYGSDDYGGVLTGSMVAWALPDVYPGQDVPIHLTVQYSSTCFMLPNSAVLKYDPQVGLPAPPFFSNEILGALAQPRLVLTRSAPSPVPPGGQATYTITATNLGGVSAVNISIWDTIADRTVFVSGSPGYTLSPGPPEVVSWTIPSLEPMQNAVVSYVAMVDTVPGCVITGPASAAFTDCVPCGELSATTFDTWVCIAWPSFELMKHADETIAPVGGTVTWRLSLTSTGSDSPINVVVWDTVPTGFTYASCGAPPGWTCSLLGSVVVWTAPEMPPAPAAVELSFVSQLTGPAVDPCDNNIAMAGSENRVGAPVGPVLGVPACAQIGDALIGMSATPSSDPVYRDGQLTFVFSLSNTGVLAAQGITLWDSLPAGADFDSCGGGTSCSQAGGLVTWQVPDLAPGATVQPWVTVIARAGMACTHFAEADYDNSFGMPRPRVASNGVCVPVVEPKMSIAVRPARNLYANGEPVTYVFSWTNIGTGVANKVTFSDDFPGIMQFQSATFSSNGDPYSLTPSGPDWTVTWDLGSIPAGDTGWATLTVLPLLPLPDVCESGQIPDWGSMKYEASKGVWLTENSGAVYVTVWDAVLRLTLTANGDIVAQGTQVTYTLTVGNACDQTIMDLTVWDSLPVGLACGEFPSGLAAWTLAPLRPYQQRQVSYTATVTGEGPWIGPQWAEAAFTNSIGLVQPPGSSNQVTTGVLAPLLAVRKTAPGEGPSGAPVTFILTVRNTGTDTAYTVVLVDSLPAPLRPVSASPTAYIAGGMAAWNIGTLAPGAAFAATVTALAPDPQQDYELTNTAVAGYTTASAFRRPDQPGSAIVILTGTLTLRVYPNPFEPARAVRGTMKFTGLPERSRVFLYTLTGVQMRVLDGVVRHALEWDGRNADGSEVAAGVYLYVVEIPDGRGGINRVKGKFGLVR